MGDPFPKFRAWLVVGQARAVWQCLMVFLPLIPGICQASTIILTNASPDHTVSSGSGETIYGTSTSNRIIIESGAKAELVHFPGNNHIQVVPRI